MATSSVHILFVEQKRKKKEGVIPWIDRWGEEVNFRRKRKNKNKLSIGSLKERPIAPDVPILI